MDVYRQRYERAQKTPPESNHKSPITSIYLLIIDHHMISFGMPPAFVHIMTYLYLSKRGRVGICDGVNLNGDNVRGQHQSLHQQTHCPMVSGVSLEVPVVPTGGRLERI